MRTFFLVTISTFLNIVAVYSQAPAIEWQKSLGGSEVDASYSIIQTQDGGYITIGETSSPDGDVTGIHPTSYGLYFSDVWVVKLSSQGSIEWKKCYGGSFIDRAYSIVQAIDGGFVIAGEALSDDGDVIGKTDNGSSAWIFKIDGKGTLLWQKTYGGYGSDVATCVRQTADGGFVVAGTTNSTDGDVTNIHGGTEYWVLKLDAGGNIQWNKCYGGNRNDGATSIQQTSDGGYIVCGTTTSSVGDVTGYTDEYLYGGTQAARYVPDAWVIKISSTGTLQWQQVIGNLGYDEANSIVQANDGGYVFTGYTNASNASGSIWNVKLSSAGNMIWQNNFGGNLELQKGVCINKTKDGGYIIGAEAVPNPLASSNNLSCNTQGLQDGWFIKMDANGNLIWEQTYGSNGNDLRAYVEETSDGGYIASVIAAEPNGDIAGSRYRDFWILKLRNAPINPTVIIVASADTICPSAMVTFTAAGTFGGTNPSYQWKKNGIDVGTNSDVFSTSGLNNHDTIHCVYTGSDCSGKPSKTAISNKVVMVVTNVIKPSLTLTASANPVCAGSSVTFSTNVLNAAPNSLFQWRINGSAIPGVTANTYRSSILNNNDTVICSIFQAVSSCYQEVADTVIMVIIDTLTPKVSISTATDTICAGTTITFAALATNGGTAPVYKWSLNNLDVGDNSNTFSTAGLKDNDRVFCTLRSNSACLSNPVVVSNSIIIKVTEPIQLSILPFNNNVCSGSDVSITAISTNSLASTQYQWRRNEVNLGNPSTTLTLANITVQGSGSYDLTATNGVCGIAKSPPISLTVKPVSTSVTKAGICQGDSLLFGGRSFNATGKYEVVLVNHLGCDSTAILDLTVHKTVTVQPMSDIITVTNVPVQLKAEVSGSNLKYLWQPSLYLNDQTIANPFSTPFNDVQYKLLVFDGACKDSAYVNIKVLPALNIPNAFSPNGDGINDTWEIKGLSSYNGAELTVYNRYGSIVFYSFGYKTPWRGTTRSNELLPIGVYFYILKLPANSKQISGSITLLK